MRCPRLGLTDTERAGDRVRLAREEGGATPSEAGQVATLKSSCGALFGSRSQLRSACSGTAGGVGVAYALLNERLVGCSGQLPKML